jgi:phenylalanyl-tRNA synthetase beta chain
MLELNRPNHPYDEAKLAGSGFVVRTARPGEQLVTLDGVTRTLSGDDNLICDATSQPIGIGGIMGGASTEVDGSTTSIVLEQAWFNPDRVVATSGRLDLRSEAGSRFERGADPYDDDYAARRFVQLLRHSSPDVQLHDPVVATGHLPAFAPVAVRVSRTNSILGTTLTAAEIAARLDPIGFATEVAGHDQLRVTIPSWRYDATAEIDVIEEIARHHGYDRIATTVPDSPHPGLLSPYQRDRRLVREVLVGLGASEVMPLPFLAPGDLERAGLEADGLVVTNPLAAEESILRTSLLPGMLRTVAFNASHRRTGARIFEVGHLWRRPGPQEQAPVPRGVDAELPDEREQVAVALAGLPAPDAVRVLDEVVAALGLPPAHLVAEVSPGLHPTRTARVEVGGTTVGHVGEVDPDVLAAHEITERVAWLELDLALLLGVPHGARRYRRVSRMPSSDVDVAFVVHDGTPAGEVEATISEAAGALLTGLALFDVYRGDPVPAGSRSLAYTLRLQAPDRTLTDADVAEVREAVIAAVTATHPARLRG